MLKERSLQEITAVEEFANDLMENFKNLPFGEEISRIIQLKLDIFRLGFDLYALNQERYFNEARH